MGDNIDLDSCMIKYEGIYDWNSLYNMIKNWLEDRKFVFDEKKLKHKFSSPKGFDSELEMLGQKRNDEYLQQKLKISFKIFDYSEVEAIKDGKKVKMAKARLEITFSGSINLDYEERWEETKFLKKLRTFYHKFIIKHNIELEWDNLYYAMLELATEVKKSLSMETDTNAY